MPRVPRPRRRRRMPRAFVPARARRRSTCRSSASDDPRFPRIVTDGGVAGAPERRARGAIARLAGTSCARVDRDDDSRDARWGGRDERERARRDGGELLGARDDARGRGR